MKNKSDTISANSLVEQLADADKIDAALHLMITDADWQAFETFLSREAPLCLAQGGHDTVAGWMDKVPPAALEQQAGMCYWLGAARMVSDLADSRCWYERAYVLHCDRHDGVGQLLSWAAIVETIFLERDDFSMLRSWIVVGERLLDDCSAFLMGELEQRVVAAMFSAMMHGQPDHPNIGIWAQRLFEPLRNIEDDSQRLLLGVPLFIYYTKWLGMPARAEIVLDMLRPPPECRRLLTPGARILLSMAECIYYWNRYAIVASSEAILDGIETAENTGIHAWDFLLHIQPVYTGLSAGDHVQANKYLIRLRELLPRRASLEQAHYYYLVGWQAMLLDDPHRALEHLNHCRSLVDERSGPMQHAMTCIALAQVHYALGENDKSPPLLASVRKMAQSTGSPLLAFMVCYTEATFALDTHDNTACLIALEKALSLAHRYDYINFAWCQPLVLARLCVKALEENIETEFVQRLIRTRHIVPDVPPMLLEHWPWPLKIFTFGRFALIKDEAQLNLNRKAQGKPLEMLKALIALGGREVSEMRLSDALWPDSDGDNVHSSFTTTLSRLRKLIGVDLLRFHDGRLSLDAHRCWVDVWALQRTLGELQHVTDTGRVEVLARKAADLYHGPFLNDEDGASYQCTRDQLCKRLVHSLIASTLYLMEAGYQNQAIALCHRILAADPHAQQLFEQFSGYLGDLSIINFLQLL